MTEKKFTPEMFDRLEKNSYQPHPTSQHVHSSDVFQENEGLTNLFVSMGTSQGIILPDTIDDIVAAMDASSVDEVLKNQYDEYWQNLGRTIVEIEARQKMPEIYELINESIQTDAEILAKVKDIGDTSAHAKEIQDNIQLGMQAEQEERQKLEASGSKFMLTEQRIHNLVQQYNHTQKQEEREQPELPTVHVPKSTVHVHSAGMALREYGDYKQDIIHNPTRYSSYNPAEVGIENLAKSLTYRHISPGLTDNKCEMAKLTSIWADSLKLAPPEMLNDPEFVECVLRYNSSTYPVFPEDIQKQESVIDIMRDVAFCKGAGLSPVQHPDDEHNKQSFVRGVPSAAALCPEDKMYSVKGYQQVAEYEFERQQRMGFCDKDKNYNLGYSINNSSALQFMALARQKFPEQAQAFNEAEQKAFEKVQERGKVPHREQPIFQTVLNPSSPALLYEVASDVQEAKYFDQYPAELIKAVAELSRIHKLEELQKRFDVEDFWQGVGAAVQKVELATFGEYSNMDNIRGMKNQHYFFNKEIENLSTAPNYVKENMQLGRDPQKQEMLDQLYKAKEQQELQNSIQTMQRIMDGAKVNDTHLKYNALELRDWMNRFDLEFLQQNLPIKEFWQSVGAAVANWEQELSDIQKDNPYSQETKYLKKDIEIFTETLNYRPSMHKQFILNAVKEGRDIARTEIQQAKEQAMQNNNKNGFDGPEEEITHGGR